MADNSEQLDFIIKAVDEASAALLSVKNATLDLKKGVDDTNASLEKNAKAAKDGKDAHESMAKEVFKGVASWDMLKEAVHVAGDFIKESAEKYLDARKSLDLTRATVESMGVSFESAKPQLDAYSESMVRMGVDGEDAELSAAKLAKMAGGDLTKGIQLSKLAADLASSGYGDLASNTDTLAAVMAGRGTAAIKQYKLNLEDGATTADILNAIQSKVTQTTEQYAQTIPGKIQTVKQAYTELQQQVGEGLVTALYDAVSGSGDMTSALDGMKEVGKALEVVVYELVQGFIAVVQSAQLVGHVVGDAINSFEALKSLLHGDVGAATAEFKASTDDLKDSFGALQTTVGKMLDPMASLDKAIAASDAAQTKLGQSAVKAGDNIANAQHVASEATVKYSDRLKQLSNSFADLLQSSSTDLASMQDDYTKAMKSITDSIAKTQQAISDLNRSYTQGAADDVKTVAEKIVASQDKVTDLKAQLAKATTDDDRANLQKQLDNEQKNLDSSAQFQQEHQDAIVEARRRASETDLQREIEDYNNRRALAAQEYAEKLADLQQQLADETANKNATIALYAARTAQIKLMLDAAQAEFIKQSQDRTDQVKSEVQAEIALFNALAQAISAAKSASASAVSTISIPTAKRAGGGSVMGGSSYIVGEKGAEIFTPDSSGTITPNDKIGGSGDINISITGTFLSEQAAQKVSDMIVKQLQRRTRIGL